MKLASRRDGRDGALIVVSKDTKNAVDATHIAKTMQAALDDWDNVSLVLEALYDDLNQDTAQGAYELDFNALCAPLPRAYQYLDGACYISHIRRNRAARGDSLHEDILDAPLIYQGISHGFMAWNDPIKLPGGDLGIDFEAEIAVILDNVPMGTKADQASKYIKLVTMINDVSLRNLIPDELAKGFGFVHSKPPSSMAQDGLTIQQLGDSWSDGKLDAIIYSYVNDVLVGSLQCNKGMNFNFYELIEHAAKTRPLVSGTVIGSGTISNNEGFGVSCIVERRMIEIIEHGEAKTPFLKFGDVVSIHSIFGTIEQEVIHAS